MRKRCKLIFGPEGPPRGPARKLIFGPPATGPYMRAACCAAPAFGWLGAPWLSSPTSRRGERACAAGRALCSSSWGSIEPHKPVKWCSACSAAGRGRPATACLTPGAPGPFVPMAGRLGRASDPRRAWDGTPALGEGRAPAGQGPNGRGPTQAKGGPFILCIVAGSLPLEGRGGLRAKLAAPTQGGRGAELAPYARGPGCAHSYGTHSQPIPRSALS